MNKIVAVLFTISCFITAAASNSILGAGLWFFIIVAVGIFVTASQFHPWFRELGGMAAFLLGMISVLAVLLTLFAATIGGSFELGGSEVLLVFGFTMIAVFGFLLTRINKKFKTYSNPVE